MIFHHILLLSGSVYHRPYTLGGVLELFTLFTVCSTRAEVAWVVVVWVVIGCKDKVRFEAPAVWEHGGWQCRDCSCQERRASRSVAQILCAVTPPHTRQESRRSIPIQQLLDHQINNAVQRPPRPADELQDR